MTVPRKIKRTDRTFALTLGWEAPPLTRQVVGAVKALNAGVANEHQQKFLFDWITKELAGVGRLSFRPGDPAHTGMLEGRRFVGLELISIAAMSGAEMDKIG